jgi:cobalt/nickel transport system ATP-binding protein
MATLLEADNITFSYDKKGPKVMDGMSMKIEEGKKTAIMGCNGAGKSTLFSLLNALRKPDSGKVLFRDKPLTYRHKDIIKMRSEVSILFQNPNDMMFKPYVEQDVAFGPENMKLPKEEIEERVQESLFAVGMEEYRKTPIMKLSYGQRKRVTLAGVLAMRPSVIIMDEPTAGLDPQMAYEVMEIAEQMHSSGVTVIMASHDTDLTYSWADELRVLHGGKCMYAGEPEPFYSDFESVQKAGLLLPTVFMMNRTLADLGKGSLEPYPRAQSQMALKTAQHKDVDLGVLHVIKAERDTDIKAIIDDYQLDGMPTGVYGMSARMALRATSTDVDFLYNGPENCTMKCLNGQDSVLICDPLMIDKAVTSAMFINEHGFGKINIDVV